MVIHAKETVHTAEEVYQLSLQGKHFELLNGELIEMSPTKQTHGAIANLIAYLITGYVLPRKLGVVYAAETGFALSNGNVLAPDVSFTIKSRIEPEASGFTTVAPDLAVEVHSASNTEPEMQEKVSAFFEAGTRLVWIVYPRSRTIYVYTAPKRVSILAQDDPLDGGEVLPGFSVKAQEIFSILDE